MATYSTIEPISRQYWSGGNLAYGGTCIGSVPYPETYSAAYPPSETINYTPTSESTHVHDPTKGQGRNWRKIKESGHISFTPYTKSTLRVENYVVSRLYDYAMWKFHQQGCSQTQTANRLGPLEGHTLFRRNSTIVEYDKVIDSSKHANTINSRADDLADAISTTQQAAFAQATSTYDPLTELAEFGETLSFLQGLIGGAAVSLSKIADTDQKSFKVARRLNAKQMLHSSNAALRKLGSRWMAYRYALMPIYYSVNDIMDLFKQSDDVYKSGRSKERLEHETFVDDYGLPDEGFAVITTGRIVTTVRSLYKTRYTPGTLQRLLAQTSFNPFSSAWESIPLSFVLDWLWNINDAIINATRIDSSLESLGVTAVRTSRIDKVILCDTTVDRANFSVGAWLDQPALTRTFSHARSVQAPLQEVQYEVYDRFIFTRPSPKVHFNPSLNWKRIIDGLVLSHKPISKLLRNL